MIQVTVSITKRELDAKNRLVRYYESRYGKDDAKEQILQDFFKDKHGRADDLISKFIERLSLDEFIQVFIYNNYEVIKSNEEKLADYYESVGNGVDGIATKLCIEHVLDILQIQIKGD
ncbi:hypothetical protein ACT7DP_29945 [Bacillus paranthracis]